MAWLHSAQDAKKEPENVTVKLQAKAQAVASNPAAKAQSLPAKLAARVNFEGYNDPRTTLQDVMDNLNDKFDVRFDVDEMAFKSAVGDRSILLEPIATAPIAPMRKGAMENEARKVHA